MSEQASDTALSYSMCLYHSAIQVLSKYRLAAPNLLAGPFFSLLKQELNKGSCFLGTSPGLLCAVCSVSMDSDKQCLGCCSSHWRGVTERVPLE